MMISIVIVFISYWVIVSSQDHLFRNSASSSSSSSGGEDVLNDRQGLCSDRDFIIFLQREQWQLAREEVSLPSSSTTGLGLEDMQFYKRSFGTVEVTLPKLKKGTNIIPSSVLVYYRIYKNANDNIRSLLSELAHVVDNENITFISQNCYQEECLHRRLHIRSGRTMKNLYWSTTHPPRYSFTFVRDPLDRFISAMSEIEYRGQLALTKQQQQSQSPPPSTSQQQQGGGGEAQGTVTLPLQSPLGSPLRVIEFINMILLSDGSHRLFQNQPFEMMHLIPMIGTLTLAEEVEGIPLRLYQLENFHQEWATLSNEANVPVLNEIFRKRTRRSQWRFHPSSSDPYHTTAAARSFFAFASLDAFERFGNHTVAPATTTTSTSTSTTTTGSGTGSGSQRGVIPNGYTVPQYRKTARDYLRVICRIYLIDYICTNYTLPLDCQDLLEEVRVSRRQYLEIVREEQSIDDISDLLRLVLPHAWMEVYAYFWCFFATSPECEARIIWGREVNRRERHEDL
eukprot:scaffold1403_cov180-Ochromonas_danica.AAC.22